MQARHCCRAELNTTPTPHCPSTTGTATERRALPAQQPDAAHLPYTYLLLPAKPQHAHAAHCRYHSTAALAAADGVTDSRHAITFTGWLQDDNPTDHIMRRYSLLFNCWR
jgi:hypothetical protein